MAPDRWLSKLCEELGITTLRNANQDVYLLLLTRCIRMFAYGSSTLVLALYLSALGFEDIRIGLFMTLTLVGDVLISLCLTFVADALGRRKILTIGALLMTLSGIVFATSSNYWVLLLAAVFGVISPSGNEIGPFRAVEESTIAHLSGAKNRSDLFAWYVVLGTVGTAGGSLTGGWLTRALQASDFSEIKSYRSMFYVYALVGLVKAAVTMCLSRACEIEAAQLKSHVSGQEREESETLLNDERDNEASGPTTTRVVEPVRRWWTFSQISRKSLMVLAKLCLLFFFDSLASGMMPSSLIILFVQRKFDIDTGKLGAIMSAAQFMSSIGNILAASIARRIGPVKTMVFTHLPSAIMLGLIPFPSSLAQTIIILVGRFSLASMDQAAKSAFLSAIVLPNERTATMGVVNTVKTVSQSSGPLITGVLAGHGLFWAAFVVAGAMKVGYDIGLLVQFVNLMPEGSKSSAARTITDDGEGDGTTELQDIRSDQR